VVLVSDFAMSPARYFPLESGRYEVKPDLFKFGTDFGNGDAEARGKEVGAERLLELGCRV